MSRDRIMGRKCEIYHKTSFEVNIKCVLMNNRGQISGHSFDDTQVFKIFTCPIYKNVIYKKKRSTQIGFKSTVLSERECCNVETQFQRLFFFMYFII